MALGEQDAHARLTNHLEAANHLIPAEDALGTEVSVRPLDTVLAELALTPTILKVDVEGHDEEVLHGGRRILEKAHPIVVVEVWAGGLSIRNFLAALGYRFFLYRREDRALVAMPSDFSGDGNLIAIHGDSVQAVEERLGRRDRREDLEPRVRWTRPAVSHSVAQP